jgi:transaldolase
MNAAQTLHGMGQSLWLDNITRDLLNSGTLGIYIRDYAITGLTSNPSIFDAAISKSIHYDKAIRDKASHGLAGEALFFELALEDLSRAADMFLPIHKQTGGMDGWASLEVSPLLVDDTAGTVEVAKDLFARGGRPNLFIKIPGTAAGVPAIEETIFSGVPVNVTLLFSCKQYVAAAEAYLRGIERRIAAGLDPAVHSVASIFVSRWDVAVKDKVPEDLQNKLGIAVSQQCYRAYRDMLASARWKKLADQGAVPQRLLWASTGTKDPKAPDTLYVEALAAPDTIDTIPEKTLLAFAEHGKPGAVLANDGGDFAAVLAQFNQAGIDDQALAAQLQSEGAAAFTKSWTELMGAIADKIAGTAKT